MKRRTFIGAIAGLISSAAAAGGKLLSTTTSLVGYDKAPGLDTGVAVGVDVGRNGNLMLRWMRQGPVTQFFDEGERVIVDPADLFDDDDFITVDVDTWPPSFHELAVAENAHGRQIFQRCPHGEPIELVRCWACNPTIGDGAPRGVPSSRIDAPTVARDRPLSALGGIGTTERSAPRGLAAPAGKVHRKG